MFVDTAENAKAMTAMAPARAEEARRGVRVLAILSALMGFASISTDLYLPAMPAMAKSLSANSGAMELTISGYLIGFSLGQLLWGPIGDRYGRRMPIVVGIILFAIGSAGCALSGSAAAMIGWRIVQAVGACAGVVLARAMVRDLYAGNRAAQMMSTLMTVMAIAPLVGPFLGGQILALSSWQAIFWTLVGFGVLTLAAMFALAGALASFPERAGAVSAAGRRPAVRDRNPRFGDGRRVRGRDALDDGLGHRVVRYRERLMRLVPCTVEDRCSRLVAWDRYQPITIRSAAGAAVIQEREKP
jgi:multidrug resistance protein